MITLLAHAIAHWLTHTLALLGDMGFVSRFVDNAVSLLDAAESALRAGYAPSDLAILISPEGGIRMVAGSDWPLESLLMHHGARTGYRVSQRDQKVRVEGKDGSRACAFESTAPCLARRLLSGAVPPMYSLAGKSASCDYRGCWKAGADPGLAVEASASTAFLHQ